MRIVVHHCGPLSAYGNDDCPASPAVSATYATSYVDHVGAAAAFVQHSYSSACGNRPWVRDFQFLPGDVQSTTKSTCHDSAHFADFAHGCHVAPALLGSSKFGTPVELRVSTAQSIMTPHDTLQFVDCCIRIRCCCCTIGLHGYLFAACAALRLFPAVSTNYLPC